MSQHVAVLEVNKYSKNISPTSPKEQCQWSHDAPLLNRKLRGIYRFCLAAQKLFTMHISYKVSLSTYADVISHAFL